MAIVENWIGPHQFLTLEGLPEHVQAGVEVLQRPGVAGVALWRDAERGRQFTLRSAVDQASIAAAVQTAENYCALVGDDPVDVIWNGFTLSALDVLYAVLAVRVVRTIAIRTAVGGLNAPSRAFLECDWDLIAIPQA